MKNFFFRTKRFFFLVEQLKLMKNINKQLKIFYSILGPWKSEHSQLIANDETRHTFNEKITQYLSDNKLDGLGLFDKNDQRKN